MASAAPSEALPLPIGIRSLSSKENYDQDTQSCRQRGRSTTQDNCSNYEEYRLVQDQLRHMKRRCAKLERKLQEKEREVQTIQDQHQLQFPLLMHETMCSLRSLDDNQSNQTASDRPLSHSVISGLAHGKQDADVRIHEYERQIAELYEENQQEKLKNEMLSECLRNQKHAKAKLMKACKHAKQELQAVKDSGLSQMLVDIEARCDALEKEKAHIADKLMVERSLREKQEVERDILAKQLENLLIESTKWEGIIAWKDEKLQQSRDQICEHQQAIDNLKADLRLGDQKAARLPEHCQEDDLEEIKRLKHIISVERATLDETKRCVSKTTAENDLLREQLAAESENNILKELAAPCAAQDTFRQVLVQVCLIICKLRALNELVKTYEETNSVDINMLNEESWFEEDFPHSGTAQSCVDYAEQLFESVSKAACYLSALQAGVEDVCARLMGSSCALQ